MTFSISAGVRRNTRTSSPVFSRIAFSSVCAETFFALRKTTLPLCRTVCTSSSPSPTQSSFNAAIESILFPPTLTPRIMAMRIMASTPPQPTDEIRGPASIVRERDDLQTIGKHDKDNVVREGVNGHPGDAGIVHSR
jgi:hypothetical protein